jgi:hypothetical protein
MNVYSTRQWCAGALRRGCPRSRVVLACRHAARLSISDFASLLARTTLLTVRDRVRAGLYRTYGVPPSANRRACASTVVLSLFTSHACIIIIVKLSIPRGPDAFDRRRGDECLRSSLIPRPGRECVRGVVDLSCA